MAAANPHTVVVLNTGGPVLMPWLARVQGVMEAWYPGEQDGASIAALLYGDVDPSGRLPVTFPASNAATDVDTAAQWPGVDLTSTYSEGLEVGYRYDHAAGVEPLFPFGYGLAYTRFALARLTLMRSATASACGSGSPTPGAGPGIAVPRGLPHLSGGGRRAAGPAGGVPTGEAGPRSVPGGRPGRPGVVIPGLPGPRVDHRTGHLHPGGGPELVRPAVGRLGDDTLTGSSSVPARHGTGSDHTATGAGIRRIAEPVSPNRSEPAFHSRPASVTSSRERPTKFHHMTNGAPNGSPPNSSRRVGPVVTSRSSSGPGPR